MKIELAHKAYQGRANVLPDDLNDWLAKGWTEVAKPKKTTVKKKDDDNE